MPRDCPSTRADLTVLKLLFDSSAMVFVGRLLIVVAAVVMLSCALFVLGSIAVRARRGHWLRRAGPFEISEGTVEEVNREAEALKNTIDEQRTRIASLETLLGTWAKARVVVHDKRDS
jgi:hypothetical protein